MPYTPEEKRAYRALLKEHGLPPEKNYKRAAKPLRQFVGIDSEGANTGRRIPRDDGSTIVCHKTFLWGAASQDSKVDWLENKPNPFDLTPEPWLSTKSILDWLLGLPAKFPHSIFVMFASSYDVTQALADLPYEKAWEIQNGLAWEEKDNPLAVKNRGGRVAIWGKYGICYLKAKHLTLYKLRDPKEPYKTDKNGKQTINYTSTIVIYDTFGFFQTSFVKASKGIPGAILPDEAAIIKAGKEDRRNFSPDRIAEIKSYTSAELRVLSRMMTILRQSLDDQDMHLRAWQGAGSVAQALMKREKVKPHLAKLQTRDIDRPLQWALHAYSGGRIELPKQGYTDKTLHTYDVRSAYPAAMRDLPSMAGGEWIEHGPEVDPRKLARMSCLSMVEVKTKARVTYEPGAWVLPNVNDPPPFYPLFYRTKEGRILYPPDVWGIYMLDEYLAALEWKEWACSEWGEDFYRIDVQGALEFVPATEAKPFAFINVIYAEREHIKKLNAEKEARGEATDVTEKVLKLGMNSLYGKTAQAVGTPEKAPSLASPWYAAAITAKTRASLLRAALTRPWDIVSFMTDGIVSEKKLPLDDPGEGLGTWEYKRSEGGAIFVQSGVYTLGKTVKTRGVRPQSIGQGDMHEYLSEHVRRLWKLGQEDLTYPYFYYATLGASLSSRDNWQFVGSWVETTRDLNVSGCGAKRRPVAHPGHDMAKRRADRLMPTKAIRPGKWIEGGADLVLSYPSKPDWIDDTASAAQALADEMMQIEIGRFGEE